MPKVSALQPSFSSGEFSPVAQGRTDSDRYKTGLNACINYLPTLQGPLIRRPGTVYVGQTKNQSTPPALIPFQFSQSQAFMLEFSDRAIRFYQYGKQLLAGPNAIQVAGVDFQFSTFKFTSVQNTTAPIQGLNPTTTTALASGQPLELQSPYFIADVAQIQFAQNGNALYLTHPSYPPYKLVRRDNNNWYLSQLQFLDGPYLGINSYAQPADQARVTLSIPGVGNSGSSTSGSFQVTAGPSYSVSSTQNNSSGGVRLTLSSGSTFQTGDKVYVTGVGGTTEANNSGFGYWTVIVNASNPAQIDLVGSTYANAYTSGGTVYPALFINGTADIGRCLRITPNSGGTGYNSLINYAITGVSSPAQATIYSPLSILSATANQTIKFFYFGVYVNSVLTGPNYPRAISFHQNRLALAGPGAQPQQIDFSATGTYENFPGTQLVDATVQPSNAMQFTLASADQNPILWLSSSAQGLLAGTQSAEWVMAASATNQAMTPTNFNASQSSYFGSAAIPAVQAGNAVLYIQRAGRKVREMNFFFQVGTYRSTDLTELAEHISIPKVTRLAVVKESVPVIYAVRSDGWLVSMTYNRDDQTIKAGWARHYLGGQSDQSGNPPLVQTIASIPSQDASFDQLWLVVKRFINGAYVYVIEYLSKVYDDSFLQFQAYQFDCGQLVDNLVVTNVTGVGSPNAISGVQTGTTTTLTLQTTAGLTQGQQVRFTQASGLNQTTTDMYGNVTVTNLLNGQVYLVSALTSTTFQITDLFGNQINSTGYTPFVPFTGQIRTMTTTFQAPWLPNETVNLLADGAVLTPVQVSSTGQITLPIAAGTLSFGYGYNSDAQTLRQDAGSAQGSALGETRRLNRVAMLVHNVGDLSLGATFQSLRPFNFQQYDLLKADSSGVLYNGVLRPLMENGYDFEGTLCFRQSSGLPGMICSLSTFMEVNDV